MDVFPPYPGKIVRFDYNPGIRSLRAYYRDGSIATCEAVPSSLVRRLTMTLTPEEFFSLYIASQYDCNVVAARTRTAAAKVTAN